MRTAGLTRRILIVGATGAFGERLARHLARTADLEIVLASRSLPRAEAVAALIRSDPASRAGIDAMALDIDGEDLADRLAACRPFVVIDCSGPFQGRDYRLPSLALAAGAHAIDLADGRDYILGFTAALDVEARSRGLTAWTGASSSPCLSAAAVASLGEGWRRIDRIEIAIVPGGRSQVGEAAIEAALSYCGRAVPIVRERRLDQAVGWSGNGSIDIPGLGRRRIAPVETADAELLHELHPGAASIRFSAGLESSPEHVGLRVLAALRRRGWLGDLRKLAPPLTWARGLTRPFNGDAGGMVVEIAGLDADGLWTQARWRLVARNGDGPQVPPSPAAAALRVLLEGNARAGARPALDLPLARIEAEFAPYAIGVERDALRPAVSLTERAIGSAAFASLPQSLRSFHGCDGEPVWRGLADVEGPARGLATFAARLVGLPAAAANVPLTVTVERRAQDGAPAPEEIWTRRFGAQSFFSRLSSPRDGEAWERFGPLRFRLGLAILDGRLRFPVAAWKFGPIPLPLRLAPRSQACEWEDEQGRFRFDVDLSLPILGRLARYRGWLAPDVAGKH